MITRRSILAALAGLPFLGAFRPKAKSAPESPFDFVMTANRRGLIFTYNGVTISGHIRSLERTPMYTDDGKYLFDRVRITTEFNVSSDQRIVI